MTSSPLTPLRKAAPWHTSCRNLFILCSPNWNPEIHNQIEAIGFENPMIIDGVRWPAAS
jgi:hypothetical protein